MYEGNTLKYIQHSEGLIDMSLGTPEYQYYLKDHLGNTRMMIDAAGNALQVSGYYPFGMLAESINKQDTNNKYRYNGKELLDDQIGGVNLDCYDYGARFYDAALARFHTLDPLAEKCQFQSSYVYANNDPVRFIDYMGMYASTHTDKDGNVIAVYEDGDLGVYKHDDAKTKSDIDNKREGSNTTGGGGEKMGETVHELSFADFDNYEVNGAGSDGSVAVGKGAKIDFGSTENMDNINTALKEIKTFNQYRKEALGSGKYNVKGQDKSNIIMDLK